VNSEVSSRWISNSAFSNCSTSTIRAGPNRHTCRHTGADAAAGAGDEHDAAADARSDDLFVELHRLAAEQVFDADLAHARHVHLVAHDLVDAGDDLRLEVRVAAQLGDAADVGAGRIRDRDQRARHVLALGDLRDVLRRAEHRQAADRRADLQRIVVEEADRVEREIGTIRDLARDHHTGLPGADEQHAIAMHALRLPRAIARFAVQPAQRADAHEPDEREHEVHREDAERHHDDVRDLVRNGRRGDAHDREQRRRRAERDEHAHDVAHVHVAPRHARYAEHRERGVVQDDDVRPRRQQHAEVLPRDVELEAEQEREPQRERQDRDVDDDLQRPVERSEGHRYSRLVN
jgi:hypothetical protein